MKRKTYCAALCAMVLAVASCSKIDNYDGPAETLKGTIRDAGTGENLQSEVSGDNGNGSRIKLLEISWSDNPTPLYLACMQDGTYNNTKVFAATYKILAEGAFVPLVQAGTNPVDKSKTVEVKGGVTTVDFDVEPFLRVEWVGNPVLNADGTITAQVKVMRGTSDPSFQQNITDVCLFINTSEYVGNNNYDNRYAQRITYTGAAGNEIVGQTLTLTTIGGALPARNYYLRVGARIDYGLRQYNYNEPKVVTVP